MWVMCLEYLLYNGFVSNKLIDYVRNIKLSIYIHCKVDKKLTDLEQIQHYDGDC